MSCSSCEFWNLSASHHSSHFLLHLATQLPLKQTRQRYTQQLLNQPRLLFFSLFIYHHVPMTPSSPTTLLAQSQPFLPPSPFSWFRSKVQFSHPPIPSLLPHLHPLPPSSRLIFYFAALPLISQWACGLTEMQGSDGGCQTVSTYLFTEIHTCIHLTSRNQQEMKGANGKAEPYYHFKCPCIYVA